MKSQELKEISERWGVNLTGFENLIIALKSSDYKSKSEALKIGELLERKGYRLSGSAANFGVGAVYSTEDGEYFYARSAKKINGYRYVNSKDIQGQQIVDKNLFFGFFYGSIFGILSTVFFWWLL